MPTCTGTDESKIKPKTGSSRPQGIGTWRTIGLHPIGWEAQQGILGEGMCRMYYDSMSHALRPGLTNDNEKRKHK